MPRSLSIVPAVVSITLLAGVALGSHTEPAKAQKAQFALVNGFFACDLLSSNTATQSFNTPACAPAAPSGFCAFSPGGSGQVTFSKTGSVSGGNEDVKIKAVVTGLNSSCEGSDLHVRLSYRLTTDDCPEGSCTTEDINDLDLDSNGAFCIVTNGKCKISTTLSTAAPGLFGPPGKNGGIVIHGCGLHPSAMLGSFSPIECGLLFN
jgi:hypothetical protein